MHAMHYLINGLNNELTDNRINGLIDHMIA